MWKTVLVGSDAILTVETGRALLVTEKQYVSMRVLLGNRYAEETYLDSTDLLEL